MAVELVRTAVAAAVFTAVADRGHDLDLGRALVLAVVLWVGFPVVLLIGSMVWEHVHPVAAPLHAGDWLLKLLLVAATAGLLH